MVSRIPAGYRPLRCAVRCGNVDGGSVGTRTRKSDGVRGVLVRRNNIRDPTGHDHFVVFDGNDFVVADLGVRTERKRIIIQHADSIPCTCSGIVVDDGPAGHRKCLRTNRAGVKIEIVPDGAAAHRKSIVADNDAAVCDEVSAIHIDLGLLTVAVRP